MCTAAMMQTNSGEQYFGRTMDFSYPLSPELFIVPRGYKWDNIQGTHTIINQYQFMGIGQDISPIIFADGINEMGFAAAVLYFPGYAQYDSGALTDSGNPPIAALELVHFLLGQCACVEQAVCLLRTIRITGVMDSVTNSVAPLHWMLADKSGACLVAEKTEHGLHLMDNPVGVLTNSPDFPWHMTNLRNYMNVTPAQKQEQTWGQAVLSPFGQGAGTFGLPGDYTPPSRFVRTAYQNSHADIPAHREGAVTACFHILDGVSIPKGVVVTDRGTSDYTRYTAIIRLSTGEYFFKTYDNYQITSALLPAAQKYVSSILSLGSLNRPITFETCNTNFETGTGD